MQPEVISQVDLPRTWDQKKVLTRSDRVLDPLLYDLCDPTVLRTQASLQLNGRQVQGFSYLKPFDQRYVVHVLGVLLSVVKFGGQGFTKITHSTPISRSIFSGLIDRTRDCEYPRIR